MASVLSANMFDLLALEEDAAGKPATSPAKAASQKGKAGGAVATPAAAAPKPVVGVSAPKKPAKPEGEQRAAKSEPAGRKDQSRPPKEGGDRERGPRTDKATNRGPRKPSPKDPEEPVSEAADLEVAETKEPHPDSRSYNRKLPRDEQKLDRHSRGKAGTSNRSAMKRGGAGSYNWGTPGQAAEGADIDQGVPATPTDEEKKEVTELPEEEAPKEEEEEKQLTLEEYRKQQEVLRGPAAPSLSLRKPGEGVDTSKWSKELVASKKTDEDENKPEKKQRQKTSGRKVESIAIDIKFNQDRLPAPKERRGGPSRSRNDDRRGNAPPRAIPTADAFPSLS